MNQGFLLAFAFLGVAMLAFRSYQGHREDSTITKNETSVALLLQAAVEENQKLKTQTGNYARELGTLDSFRRAEFIGAIQAFDFSYRNASDSFSISANPRQPGKTGLHYFYVNQTGVRRYDAIRPAGQSSHTLPQ